MLLIICQHCHQQIQVPQEALGKSVRCPLCKQVGRAALPTAEIIEKSPAEAMLGIAPSGPADPPLAAAAPPVDAGVQADPLASLLTAGKGRRRARTEHRQATRDALSQFAQAPAPEATDPLTAATSQAQATDANGALAGLAGSGEHPPQAMPPPRKARSIDWFILSGDYEYGPFRPEEIAAVVRAGRVSPGVPLRSALGGQAITAGQLMRQLAQADNPKPGGRPRTDKDGA